MPGVSELAREEAEALPVQSTAPLADAGMNEPAPFALAMIHALAGQPIPRSVQVALAEEGGDFTSLTNAIRRHRRG